MRPKADVDIWMVLIRGIGVLGLLFLLLPVLVVVLMSFGAADWLEFPPKKLSVRWYAFLWETTKWRDAFVRSILLAAMVSIMGTLVGGSAAYARRLLKGLHRSLWDLILLLPIFIPAIVLGPGQRMLFGGFSDSLGTIALCHTALAAPVAYLILRPTIAGKVVKLEGIAEALGSGPVYSFFTIALPATSRQLLASLLLTFLVSFDEAVIVLFVAGRNNVTLPRLIFDGIRYDLTPAVASAAGLVILIGGVLLIGYEMITPAPSRRSRR